MEFYTFALCIWLKIKHLFSVCPAKKTIEWLTKLHQLRGSQILL